MWKKPSRPSVCSGTSRGGSMPSISQASFSAFTMVSLALPGCAETPVMRNTADAALKFS